MSDTEEIFKQRLAERGVELSELTELGKKLFEIRLQIEAEPGFKPLSTEEVRRELCRRRCGDFEEDD